MWTISSFHVHVCQIDDDISAKHRLEVINTPDIAPPAAKRKQSRKGKATDSSIKTPSSMDDGSIDLICDRIMNKLTEHIKTAITQGMEQNTDMSAQVTWAINL